MGRLSTFAKNRILNLRFQKSFRIKQIAISLQQEDDIKVSRKSISTFLKKYIETKSIHDKPRSGRNKKLTPDEINLIGEITRLNRDITAPKIKEYLNLSHVSTYTILRASKLFEWNKLNPNSNEAKKAAALKRQMNGEIQKRHRKAAPSTRKIGAEQEADNSRTYLPNSMVTNFDIKMDTDGCNESDLKLLSEHEIINARNASSSAMVFATKILYKIFHLSELLGHNVSGKTFNKYIKHKKALHHTRVNYIRYLVENYFEPNNTSTNTSNRDELWKSCRTAINKSIRNNEIKGGLGISNEEAVDNKSSLVGIMHDNEDNSETHSYNIVDLNSNVINESIRTVQNLESIYPGHSHQMLNLEPNMSIFQMSTELPCLDLEAAVDSNGLFKMSGGEGLGSTVVTLGQADNSSNGNGEWAFKKDLHSVHNLRLLSDHHLLSLKHLHPSPMIFSTKVLVLLFTKSELLAQKQSRQQQPLDDTRINYINWLVHTYFTDGDGEEREVAVWRACRKAINRVIRNIEVKEGKLDKSMCSYLF